MHKEHCWFMHLYYCSLKCYLFKYLQQQTFHILK